MDLDTLLKLFEKTGIPQKFEYNGAYAIYGSGPMSLHGLKQPNDLDILVNHEVWQHLIDSGHIPQGEKILPLGNDTVEIFKTWVNEIDPASVIRNAKKSHGYWFADLRDVLEWKRRRMKPKDLVDAKVIEEYLAKEGENGTQKITARLDSVADTLEDRGFLKEAYDLDVVSNTIEAARTPIDETYVQRVLPENIRIAISDLLQESLDMDNSSAYRAAVATLQKYPELARTLGEEINKVLGNKSLPSSPEPLGMVKKANEKPTIFTYTTYRDPTDEELINVDRSNLPAKEVLHGFYYTIVGRGFLGEENKQQIVNAIDRLCKMYPDNKEYKTALDNAKELKPKF